MILLFVCPSSPTPFHQRRANLLSVVLSSASLAGTAVKLCAPRSLTLQGLRRPRMLSIQYEESSVGDLLLFLSARSRRSSSNWPLMSLDLSGARLLLLFFSFCWSRLLFLSLPVFPHSRCCVAGVSCCRLSVPLRPAHPLALL